LAQVLLMGMAGDPNSPPRARATAPAAALATPGKVHGSGYPAEPSTPTPLCAFTPSPHPDRKVRATVAAIPSAPGGVPALSVLGRGKLGVEELAQCVADQDRVLWGIVRFRFGAGSFARHKRVFLHLNFARSTVARGRQNAHTNDVQKAVGSFHASVTIEDPAEVSLDEILERVQNKFIADGDVEFAAPKAGTANALKAEIEAQIAAQREAETRGSARETMVRKASVSVKSAFRAVCKPAGVLNWVWLTGPAGQEQLWAAGQDSIAGMQAKAAAEGAQEVLHGLLRVPFGKGKLRRSKWAYVAWIGPELGAVKRGKLISGIPGMQEVIRKQAVICATFEFTDPEDFTTDAILTRIRQVALLDGDAAQDIFSLESYLAAMQEEADLAAREEDGSELDEDEDAASGEAAPEEPDFAETLAALSDENGAFNWAVFTLSAPEMRKSLGRAAKPAD